MSFLICDVCGAHDSHVSNGDCDGCSECYSIEGGFTEYYEPGSEEAEEAYWAQFPDMWADSKGYLYLDTDEEFQTPVACAWYPNNT